MVLALEDLDSHGFSAIAANAEEWFAPHVVSCSDPTDIRRLDATGVAISLSGAQLALQVAALWVAMRHDKKTPVEMKTELRHRRFIQELPYMSRKTGHA